MKKVLFYFLLLFIVPIFISFFISIKEDNISYKRVNNIKIRVKREAKNKIEEIFFEDYILGVLAGEMPVSFHEEALKAQAVCARSYALKKMQQNKNKTYDVTDTISNQVYQDDIELKKKWGKNYSKNKKKLIKVIEDTKGQYMTYENEVIEAFFFSTSNGKTENVEEVFSKKLPYLRSVDSTWDKEVSPVFYSVEAFSFKDFYEKLNLPFSNTLNYEVLKKTNSGAVSLIKINNKEFKGTELRNLLSLRSTYFDIKIDKDTVTFHTQGFGHGVGLSQYGALAMANKGYSYLEILNYYYQGIEISKL